MNRIRAPLAQVLCLCGMLLFWGCESPREAPEEAQTPQTAPRSEENVVMTESGQDFLGRNGAREEVITTDSGLQYEVLVSGDGASPAPADLVTVHYTGTLIDGTVFDSSVQRGQPAEFPGQPPDRGLGGSPAAHAGRRQVDALHPAGACLRRPRGGTAHRSRRDPDFRNRTPGGSFGGLGLRADGSAAVRLPTRTSASSRFLRGRNQRLRGAGVPPGFPPTRPAAAPDD